MKVDNGHARVHDGFFTSIVCAFISLMAIALVVPFAFT
jgi:hypothetical protein